MLTIGKPNVKYGRQILKSHMVHHWPKELLIWHCKVLYLGQMALLITIGLSLAAFTVC